MMKLLLTSQTGFLFFRFITVFITLNVADLHRAASFIPHFRGFTYSTPLRIVPVQVPMLFEPLATLVSLLIDAPAISDTGGFSTCLIYLIFQSRGANQRSS